MAVLHNTREINKEKRRQRILNTARQILAMEGYDALNARHLAKAASVTTPTLYNLVGTKEEVLRTLSLDSLDQFGEAMRGVEDDDALTYFDGLIAQARKTISADQAYYRSTLLAICQLSLTNSAASPETEFCKKGALIAAHGCRIAEQQKLLLGKIPAEALGEQMFTVYFAPWREWAYRQLSLEQFLCRAHEGFYISLCADASPKFLKLLRERLSSL